MTNSERSSIDKDILRACVLQAKWNGTTVEEEYKLTMSYKNNGNKKMDISFNAMNKIETNIKEALANRLLEDHEAQACRYYNKYIKDIKNPCEGKECSINCEYCLELI